MAILRAVRGSVVLLLLLAALTVGASSASARTYRGVMTNGAGAVHSGEQGTLWQSRFVEHKHGRMLYSACVIYLDARQVVSCKPGTTNRKGVDRVDFTEFVNLRAGHYVVRFIKLGRKLSAWRFTVRSEDS
jgi:hypothetical protein